MARYSVSYQREGEEFSFDIWADSFEDAARRVQSVMRTATLWGEADGPVLCACPPRPANEAELDFAKQSLREQGL